MLLSIYGTDGRTGGQADVRDDANALSLFDQTDRTCTDTVGGGALSYNIHGQRVYKGKGKVFPYSLPSVGPGADPGVQAVSPQVT